MSYERPDAQVMAELEQLVRNATEELTGWRRRERVNRNGWNGARNWSYGIHLIEGFLGGRLRPRKSCQSRDD